MEIIREILEQQRRVDEQREALRILIHRASAAGIDFMVVTPV